MRKIRELLRLKYELGRSHREIAASLGIANSTVSDYVRRASTAGFSVPAVHACDRPGGIGACHRRNTDRQMGVVHVVRTGWPSRCGSAIAIGPPVDPGNQRRGRRASWHRFAGLLDASPPHAAGDTGSS